MNIEHLKKFVGATVIVQLTEAVALGTAAGPGRLVPQCNEEGQLLCRDGSVAHDGTKPDELAMRPAWPIKAQRDAQDRVEFRFAIEDAFVTLGEGLVHITYRDGDTLMMLTVLPEAIFGITRVVHSPSEKQESRIVRPD